MTNSTVTINTAGKGKVLEKEILFAPPFIPATGATSVRAKKLYESGTVLDGRLQFISNAFIPADEVSVGCVAHETLSFLDESIASFQLDDFRSTGNIDVGHYYQENNIDVASYNEGHSISAEDNGFFNQAVANLKSADFGDTESCGCLGKEFFTRN